MIGIESVDGVAIARLEHGKVNVMDLEFCQEIAKVLPTLAGERAVVLTGAGRAFSAGVDLKRMLDGGAEYVAAFLPALSDAFQAVFDLPNPVVAAVNGHAIAGGAILAAAADHRLMSAGTIGVPEIFVGVPFPASPYEIVNWALGPVAGRRAILTGAVHGPDQAVAHGLADETSTPESLLDTALARASVLASVSPDTFAHTKRQLRAEASARIAAARATGEPEVLALWTAAATDGRIHAYMEKAIGAR
ncbi:enoyl-CoA hydratase/isomerase family protein [Actinocorallia longicatena]|uniref:Enoyl-CoA hydratase/isomerase family protein n=1 Tax=Actinocorallia longicatena TaxID=111803 RepID=A0ABP6QIW4_9ACTN